MRRSPRTYDLDQTRWTLDAIRRAYWRLADCSLACIHGLLKRLGIVWKRAREAVYSPDPHYDAKRAWVAQLREQAATSGGRSVVVFLDEITIGRQPTVANAYAPAGVEQARAWRSHSADTLTRVVATLDAGDGRVVFRRAGKITVETLVQFYQELRAAYPDAERIYVVQDNWPIHTHPDVLAALEPQESPFAWHRPAAWSTEPSAAARRKWGTLQLPIQIVPLPTYASWCNPIEKLWRKLRQDVTHLHLWADELPELRAAIDAFLAQFADGSAALLQYVGLGPPQAKVPG